jgi:hypothetical protein
MKRLHAVAMILSLAGGAAAAAEPTVCSVLGAQEIQALVGEPLGKPTQREESPSADNGGDHKTSCTYYAEGYNYDTADGPPHHGLSVELHTLADADHAGRFYGRTRDMVQDSAKDSGGGTKVTPLDGIGQSAFLKGLEFKPGENAPLSHVATVFFLKGRVSGQVTVWKQPPGAGDAIAKAAAKQLAAKLP